MKPFIPLLMVVTVGLASSSVQADEPWPASVTAVADAVVRIEGKSEHARSGVIISEDGHVVWSGSPHSTDMNVILPSGESVAAKNLGWSSEWDIGLLKLSGDRTWPFAKLGTTDDLAASDSCFEIGYRSAKVKEGKKAPTVRSGRLTIISPSRWFVTNLEPTSFEYGAGVFDERGQLIGITNPGPYIHVHSSTAVEVLASNLQSLTDDLNLDWVRFPPSESSPYQRIAPADQLPATGFVTRTSVPALDKSPAEIDKAAFKVAQKVAEATTVRIEGGKYSNGREKVWSGVLISPNGLIATCAHTMQLPGDRLTVTLPNGKKVAAKALGANWVSDVGVVQIIEEGPWEYAELGDSSLISPEGAVLCAGFPFPQAPPVTTEIFSLQRTPYVGWAKDMSFAPSMTLSGGASGGGVFDANGRLAAIYAGPGHGHRVELLRAQLDDLTKENETLVEQPHQ